MTIATQSDLVAAVSNWLYGRSDLAARVPDFIALFEAKANRLLFCRQMETRAYATVDPNSIEPEFLALPSDFQTMRRIRVLNSFSPTDGTSDQKTRLKFATGPQLDKLREENPAPGVPIWFGILGSELEMLPTPDQAYQIEMVYRTVVPPLASNSTNWLLTFAPDAYLYGVLMEAAPYLMNDDRISVWSSALTSVIQQLNTLSERAQYDAGPLTIRRTRRPY